MSITMEFEYELNRAWILDEDKDTIGETNFVVTAEWLEETFCKLNEENKFVCKYEDFEDFLAKNPECQGKLYMATTKAKHVYTDVRFEEDAYIMFGKESAGIPEEILVDYEETCVRIPMLENIRSLNLSNSVAVVLYEALRQQNFKQMQLLGELHRLHWKE